MTLKNEVTIDDLQEDQYGKPMLMRHLRKMIKLGKIAERAYQNIQETGYYNGRVLVIENVNSYRDDVVKRVLSKKIEVRREDTIPMHDLTVSVEDGGMDYHGSNKFPTARLSITGTHVMFNKKNRPTFEVKTTPWGSVRILKTGYTLNSSTWGSEVFKLYSDFKNPNEKMAESCMRMAQDLANNLILSSGCRTYYATDMIKHVQGWLISEGHVQRIMKDIISQTKVLEVMEL